MTRFLPLLAVMIGIFFVSHQPGSSIDLPLIPGIDKVLHGFAYAVLAAAASYAFPEWLARPVGRFRGVWIVLFCVLYGLSDEFHQTFIPQRTATLGDLMADGFGAFCWVVVSRRFGFLKLIGFTGE